MKIDEIRKKSDKELLDAIDDNRRELFIQRMNLATGELKDVNQIRATKRELARLKTVMTERRLAAQKVSDEGK